MAEKILIVDDDLETLRLVGLMLQRQGYEIAAAGNGHQALLMAKSEQPDLILLDVMMPDMDGVEVTRRLRADPETASVPIIMFTAKSQVDDKVLGFEAGADDYLTKPTQPRELFAHVKAVLGRAKKAHTPPPLPAPVERGYMIGVMSVRGGLGVTTMAINLGVALRERYKRETVVADFRPGQGTLGLELGYLRPEGLNRLLERDPGDIDRPMIDLELVNHPTGVRLLLASIQPRDAAHLSKVDHFEALAHQLSLMARYTVIDLGPAITPIHAKVLPQCDEVQVVLDPMPQTILQTKALLADLYSAGIGEGRISLLLVNRIRSGMQLSWSQVQEQLGQTVAGIFTPAPELAFQAAQSNIPMIVHQPDSLTAQQFVKLAERVSQRNAKLTT